jgi:hypothetical protein
MTSLQSRYDQLPSNKLYVNLAAIQSSITDSNLSSVSWVTNAGALGQLSTAGAAILRDMGKTIYLPSPTNVPTSAVAGISTVLRKVQLVPSGGAGSYGTGGAGTNSSGSGGAVPDYFTGYIQLGGLTYGGGNGTAARVARLN